MVLHLALRRYLSATVRLVSTASVSESGLPIAQEVAGMRSHLSPEWHSMRGLLP